MVSTYVPIASASVLNDALMSDGALLASSSKYFFTLSVFPLGDPAVPSASPSFVAAPAKLRQLFETVVEPPLDDDDPDEDDPEELLPDEPLDDEPLDEEPLDDEPPVDELPLPFVTVEVPPALELALDFLEPPHALTARITAVAIATSVVKRIIEVLLLAVTATLRRHLPTPVHRAYTTALRSDRL